MGDEISRKYIVYQHTNTQNGKVYIGITSTTMEQRAGVGGQKYRKNILFYRAIQKYGWDCFRHEVLFSGLSKAEATQKERHLIAESKSNDPLFGYNISSGGESGYAGCHASAASRTIRSKRVSGSNNPMYGCVGALHPNYGKKQTQDHIEKVRIANIGKTVSYETRQKISQYRTSIGAWSGDANPMYGKTGDKAPQARAVMCVETGEIYSCIKYAATAKQVLATSITACCKGRVKTAGGFHWQYA